MKDKKYIMELVIAIIVIILIVLFLIIQDNKKTDNQILSNDMAQAEVLKQIYMKFLGGFQDRKIVLDESTYTNFITGDKFPQEQIDDIENLFSSSDVTINDEYYVFSIKYSNGILELMLDSSDGYYKAETMYKIYVENEKILYETDGVITQSMT